MCIYCDLTLARSKASCYQNPNVAIANTKICNHFDFKLAYKFQISSKKELIKLCHENRTNKNNFNTDKNGHFGRFDQQQHQNNKSKHKKIECAIVVVQALVYGGIMKIPFKCIKSGIMRQIELKSNGINTLTIVYTHTYTHTKTKKKNRSISISFTLNLFNRMQYTYSASSTQRR